MAKDYYQILGLQKDASENEIKVAYRKLAHKYHPDKGGSEQKFKEINEAYQILSDKEKRSQYDRFGKVPGSGGFDPGFDFGAGFDFESMRGKFQDSPFDFMDLGDIFEDAFGFGRQQRKGDLKRGKDIEVDIEIPLEAILKTGEEKIVLNKQALCPRCRGLGGEPGTKINECFSCRGAGEVQQIKRTFLGAFTRLTVCPECGGEGRKPEKPCNVCRGEGRVKSEEEIRVFIPAGVDSNQIIKMEGRGEAGKKGGAAGDLYVRIFVRKHQVFQRKGDDLHIRVPVSFSQAALGDEIEAPILDGTKILLTIPSGVESGKVLRVSGKGIPHFSGYGRGNMYVEIFIKTPKTLTKKQKELLEKLREEGL